MSKIQTHIIGLLTALNTSSPIISVAYAEQSLTHELQADQAGGGCMGKAETPIERSSGLSLPDCVGAGCMGY